MCGKYGGPPELEVFAGYLDNPPPFAPRDDEDLWPLKTVPVLARNGRGQTVVKDMRWGLIPAAHTGPLAAWRATTFHARLETVATTPSFANAWRRKRRVLFPMQHFYEKARPQARPGAQPGPGVVAITRADDRPLAVAGLYDHAETVDGPVLSAAMLTRAPGPRMALVHNREPVVLEPDTWKAWLGGSDDIDLAAPWADNSFNIWSG